MSVRARECVLHDVGYAERATLDVARSVARTPRHELLDLTGTIPDPMLIQERALERIQKLVALNVHIPINTIDSPQGHYTYSPLLRDTERSFKRLLMLSERSIYKLWDDPAGNAFGGRDHMQTAIFINSALREIIFQLECINLQLEHQPTLHDFRISSMWPDAFMCRCVGEPFFFTSPSLGRGRYGSVYPMRDDHNFVLKRIDGEPSPLESAITARHEYTFGSLIHAKMPYLFTAKYLFFGKRGRPYLLIPRVRGTLRSHASDPTTLGALVSRFKRSARALHFIHAEGITHGDIKADNIAEEGGLLDFSLAEFVGESQHTTVGCLRAPEACLYSEAYSRDTPSDIWALGGVFLWAFSGEYCTRHLFACSELLGLTVNWCELEYETRRLGAMIFRSEETLEMFQQYLDDRVVHALEDAMELPREHPMTQLLLAMLRIAPDQRPTAQEVSRALKVIGNNEREEGQ